MSTLDPIREILKKEKLQQGDVEELYQFFSMVNAGEFAEDALTQILDEVIAVLERDGFKGDARSFRIYCSF